MNIEPEPGPTPDRERIQPAADNPAAELLDAQRRLDLAASDLLAAVDAHAEAFDQFARRHADAQQVWTRSQLLDLGVAAPINPTDHRPGPAGTVPLTTLADLGVASSRGPDWAGTEIQDALADAGCHARPDGPRTAAIIEVAGNRLTSAYAAALPDGLHLVDDVVWGPPATDRARLASQAMRWRDHAGIADIVARTGLWRPPDPGVMPRVRIEGRRDEATPAGHRLGTLATRDTAQYWAVYGELPYGLLDLAADFATEQAARRYAARWDRPGALVYADHTEDLPAPLPAAAVMGRRPRSWHTRPVHRSTPPPRGLHT